jgi:nucleoside-diphosphate-sugar epimerase
VGYQKIVVTGGAGRLGKYITKNLQQRDLTIVDRLSPNDADLRFVEADVTDYAALQGVFTGQDAVLHLAAIPNPRSAPAEATFRTNVQGTWAVLQAAEDCGVKRVIVASSDAALGIYYNTSRSGPKYLPVDEDHPLRPVEFYSLSKECTESICRSYANRGSLEVMVIRPTHVVFPAEYPELEARGADVQNYHMWTYVAPEDVAEGFRCALDAIDGSYEAFFITASDGLNTRPTLDMLRERYGAEPPVRKVSYFESNPFASILDGARARARLGFAPTISWRDMLGQREVVRAAG